MKTKKALLKTYINERIDESLTREIDVDEDWSEADDPYGDKVHCPVGSNQTVVEKEHEVKFGTLHEDGTLSDVRMIKQSDIGRCPHYIMVPSHYRDDGTCKCDDPTEQKMMIKEWGYKKKDFKKKGRAP